MKDPKIPEAFFSRKWENSPEDIRLAARLCHVDAQTVRQWILNQDTRHIPAPIYPENAAALLTAARESLRIKEQQWTNAQKNPFESPLQSPDTTLENPFEESPVARADKSIVVPGDTLTVFDLHVPQQDHTLLFKACKLAQRYGVKNVLFGGDMLCCNAWNPKHQLAERRLFSDDVDMFNRIIDAMEDKFGFRAYGILGNHEAWSTRAAANLWNPKWFFDKMCERMTLTDNEWCDIESGDVLTRVEHGTAYSATNPLGPVQKLAAKYQQPVISGHQHLAAVGWSTCGKYQCVSSGGMFDPARVKYANQAHRPSPVMQQGFVITLNGWSYHYDAMHPEVLAL